MSHAPRRVGAINRIIQAVAAVAGLAVLWRVWWMSARGLDLTDEGMYLNWLTAPWQWPWASTQFAFVYHPLWSALGQDVVATRRWAVLLLLACAAVFYAVLLRRAGGLRWGRSILWAVILAPTALLAVGSQSVFFTPNYNMLGMVGLLLAGAALIGIILPPVPGDLSNSAEGSGWPWVLLGVAGVACFASRPTAGALLLLIVMVSLIASRTWSWAGLALAAGTAVATLLILAVVIDGSPVRFVDRVLEGINLYSIQTRRSALDALVNTFTYDVSWRVDDLVFGALLALLAALALVTTRVKWLRWLPALIASGAAMVAVAAAVLVWTPLSGSVERSATVTLLLTVGVVVPSLIMARGVPRREGAVAVALLLLPFAYAFGTHYSTVALAGSAAFCWLGASLLILGRGLIEDARVAAVAAVWLLATVLCLNAAADAAPRQEPLREQVTPVNLAGRGEVAVSADMARYLGEVAQSAHSAGYEPGSPVLDLTGESPGLVYHLAATPTADSWVIGRYPGSRDRLARQLMLHTDCSTIADSWLLTTPDGNRRIDPEVLSDVGIQFPADYQKVGENVAPERSGGYVLELWQPLDEESLTQRCAARR